MPKLEKPVVAEETKVKEPEKIVDTPPEEKITEKEPLESPPVVLASPEAPKATPIGTVVLNEFSQTNVLCVFCTMGQKTNFLSRYYLEFGAFEM